MSKVKGFKRDSNGLVEGVEHTFNEQGFVDWRKMVKPEYLVPNRDRTSETDVTKLEDKNLLILLGGIKELAQIRGYSSVEYDVVSPSADYVVATCRIKWTPNYETEGREVVFSAIGDASPENTTDFTKWYLAAMAENRAFVRCVRNFLKINIVGNDELEKMTFAKPFSPQSAGSPTEEIDQPSPVALLKKVMAEKKVDFDRLKKRLEDENYDKIDSISSVESIPKAKIFELITRLKKVKA